MWQLRSIKQALSPEATRTLIHAFISSRFDYCNSILVGVSSQLLQKLQVVQNATTRLVTGARKWEHMTPVLRELHWLPIRRRITFKTAVLAYKCQHDVAPKYLQSYCESTSMCTSRGHLRSAQTRQSLSFPERGQSMATKALPSKNLVSDTVYLLSCELQTFHRQYSETN